MGDESGFENAFVDFLPNQAHDDQARELFRKVLRDRFEGRLPDAIERIWKLPPLAVEQSGVYVELLLEARELFVGGYFYSCVAMCGIAAERLVKDLLRRSLLIDRNGQASRPGDTALDQFERVEVHGIVTFLRETALLSEDAAKAALDLGRLRNRYVHARGRRPEADATKAIAYLQTIIEATVSLFRRWDSQDGISWAQKSPPE